MGGSGDLGGMISSACTRLYECRFWDQNCAFLATFGSHAGVPLEKASFHQSSYVPKAQLHKKQIRGHGGMYIIDECAGLAALARQKSMSLSIAFRLKGSICSLRSIRRYVCIRSP